MSEWELYSAYFAGGIPYGEYICSIFIIALCAIGVIYARKAYNKLWKHEGEYPLHFPNQYIHQLQTATYWIQPSSIQIFLNKCLYWFDGFPIIFNKF